MYPSLLTPVPPVALAEPAGGRRGRILVVDDEVAVREFVGAALRAGGYTDVAFSVGGAAVPTLALSERPQLIIMDVMMPRGNGMKALRALRNCQATADIPVIITSGFHVPSPEDGVAGRADHLLPKPFTVEQLLSVVGRLMRS
jgi:two-component system response regulator MprA